MKNINLTELFKKYISPRIPQKITNILYSIVNGTEAAIKQIEIALNITKRERNILTANEVSSLRNLSAQNGYEPELKIPARGILGIQLETKLFNRVGFPLYLLPYTSFKCKESGLSYYYDSNNTMKLDNDIAYIPVVEGNIVSKSFVSTGDEIQRFYLDTELIADKSIIVSVNNTEFVEVKSFYDNININDNKQFVMKYSTLPDLPIVLYVKGTNLNDSVSVTYRTTNGELGNLKNIGYNFQTDGIINTAGDKITLTDGEFIMQNVSGFDFGSNGSTINSLKSAIGYNHGIELLFDNTSYKKFLEKYSTLITQKIIIDQEYHQINNIYLIQKNYINPNLTGIALKTEYKNIVNNSKFWLNQTMIDNLSSLISEKEFTLSSHNIIDGEINKFAVQIEFETQIDNDLHTGNIEELLYNEFSKFLWNKYHQVNIEVLFDNYKKQHNIEFDYTLFNMDIEKTKLETQNSEIPTPTTITHLSKLPILKGDFDICDIDNVPYKLFFDINNITKI